MSICKRGKTRQIGVIRERASVGGLDIRDGGYQREDEQEK